MIHPLADMVEIIRYEEKYKNEWNNLIDASKNGTFLINRNYMDYHSTRFIDFSLLIYQRGRLVAVFPANLKNDVIYSHQGLTYGGLIYTNLLTTKDILLIFMSIKNHYRDNNVQKIIYKAVPYIYTTYPAQEDLYALFGNDARLIGCNMSSTVLLNNRLRFTESRICGIRKAGRKNLTCIQSNDYKSFWSLLTLNLETKYNVKPVHSLQEIEYLHHIFPENIKLFEVKEDEKVIAGTVLYISKKVVHTQYIAASPEGKELGALDMLFDFLINKEFAHYDYFDFGQSTEHEGVVLNENLIFQKEGFGGRGVVYEVYEFQT